MVWVQLFKFQECIQNLIQLTWIHNAFKILFLFCSQKTGTWYGNKDLKAIFYSQNYIYRKPIYADLRPCDRPMTDLHKNCRFIGFYRLISDYRLITNCVLRVVKTRYLRMNVFSRHKNSLVCTTQMCPQSPISRTSYCSNTLHIGPRFSTISWSQTGSLHVRTTLKKQKKKSNMTAFHTHTTTRVHLFC